MPSEAPQPQPPATPQPPSTGSPSGGGTTAVPAEVSLISNPIPSFSVYQWMPRGVRNLNRRNKLSSLPFWFPNDKMRHHQFRLVLLRGVVRAEEEADDPVAVFLEYVPPPTIGAADAVAANNSQHPLHPKGCRITMRLANRRYINDGDRSFDVVTECTASIDPEDRQVAFREFIGANVLSNAAFVGDDGSTMILEVSILSGVNVVADTVAKSAGSLWSTFSSLSTSVSTFVKKTVQSVQDHRDEIREGDVASSHSGSAAAAGGHGDLQHFFGQLQSMVGGGRSGTTTPQEPPLSRHRELPWDAVPERWVGREAAWSHTLTRTLVEDENTFLVGSKRGITSEEQMLMTQFGLNHRAITAADSLFDYDRDVHEGLLSLPQLRAQRYRLVPQKLPDALFWSNYMWKVACLSTCGSDEQAQLLLSIINSPLRMTAAADGTGADGGRSSTGSALASWMQFAVDGLSHIGAGGGKPLEEAEVVHAVQEALEAAATLEDLLRDDEESCKDEDKEDNDGADEAVFVTAAMRSCEGNKVVLERLMRRQGAPELHESLAAAVAALSEQLATAATTRSRKVRTSVPEVRSPPCSPQVQPDDATGADATSSVDGRSPVRSVADDASATVGSESNGGALTADGEPEGQQCEAEDVATPLGADDDCDSDTACEAPAAKRCCRSPPAEVQRNDAASSTMKATDGSHDAPAPPPHPPAAPTAAVATGSDQDDADDSFERLPSIDDMATPTGGHGRRSASHGSATFSSNKKLEFAPMPWEEDDDA